jgi:hypothetical protein
VFFSSDKRLTYAINQIFQWLFMGAARGRFLSVTNDSAHGPLFGDYAAWPSDMILLWH